MIIGSAERCKNSLLLCLLVIFVMGWQELAIPLRGSSQSLHWAPKKTEVPSSGTVRVSLSDLPSGARYAVGFRATNVAVPTFVVGAAQPGKQESQDLWLISAIDDWPSDGIRVSDGSIKISGIAKSGAWLLVYGEAPAGTQVEIDGPNGLIASGKIAPNGGLLVRDGTVLGVPVIGGATVISSLMHGPLKQVGNTKPILVRKDTYFVTPAGLARHIQNFVRPSYPPGQLPQHDGTIASLLLTIGPDGRVEQVDKKDGDAVALEACEGAIEQWQFTPFAVNGTFVTVHAPLRFIFAKDGSVTSPILTSMAAGR